jgi:hypothetical protein
MKKQTRKRKTPAERLREIEAIIDHVETRCMAYDGPVGQFKDEVTVKEMREIYRLATRK